MQGMYESQLRIRWHLAKVRPNGNSSSFLRVTMKVIRHPCLRVIILTLSLLPFASALCPRKTLQDSTTGAWLTDNVSVIRPGPI